MGKTQPETTHVARPFDLLLKDRGWMLSNINPGIATDSLPDRHACHAEYGERWIEYKIWYGNSIKCSRVQKIRFPKLIANGCKIWCIVHEDLRGESMEYERERMYGKLFEEPNGYLMYNRKTWNLLK